MKTKVIGLRVVVELLAGVTLQRALFGRKHVEAHTPASAAVGL